MASDDDRTRILAAAAFYGDAAHGDAARAFALGGALVADTAIAAVARARAVAALDHGALIAGALRGDHEAIAEAARRRIGADVLHAAEHRETVARAVALARSDAPPETVAAAWAEVAKR